MNEEKRFSEYQRTFQSLKMTKMDNENTFSPQKKGNNVRLLAGVDEGNYAISVISHDQEFELTSTSLIKIKKVHVSNNQVAIIFVLTDEQLLSIFISFAIDLESVIEADQKVTTVEIYNRYLYWQKMFKALSNDVSESTVKGLINELYLLENYMIPKYGMSDAIKGWVGSEGIHKDFAYNDSIWYEAKAINSGKVTVQISSVEQLQSDVEGLLLITEIEKTSSQNPEGIRLFDLLNRIKDAIEVESIQMIFIEKVFSLGINPDIFSDPYQKGNLYRYIIKSVNCYKVGEDFPRLSREQLPNAFGLISYEIIIAEIEKYKVDFF